jgi:hypothetical protein
MNESEISHHRMQRSSADMTAEKFDARDELKYFGCKYLSREGFLNVNVTFEFIFMALCIVRMAYIYGDI